MGVENIDSYQELKKLDEQIESATELAALKPIYFRLNEIIQAFPGDFDVQFTGNEVKQRLMARGTLLKQQGISPSPPAPPQPAMPETQPPPLPTPFPETVAAAPVAEPEPLEPVASPAPPEPPAPRESSVMITAAPSPSFPRS